MLLPTYFSRFCDLYRGWEGKLSVTMRQSHAGGEKLFVDYAGDRVEVFDRLTGEARPAWIFVAVMGASSFTYAEATWTPGSGGLDRRPYQGVRGHWRCRASDRAGQHQDGGDQILPV